ncbi:MAG: sensor histidine kinase, partial [Sporomusa sp.]
LITITDSVLVGQIINILLDNAIKYTEQGGWILITLAKERTCAVFTIQNSGKGISKQDLPKVFDRFYQADVSRSQSRSSYGLGLSIAKASIDKLGGTIEAESIENKQTVFTVKIPC